MGTNDPGKARTEDFSLIVEGHRLAARWLRPAGAPVHDRPVLVFLHEGLGSMRLWSDFPHIIVDACGLPALLYDRLGHGVSDPLPSAAPDVGYLEREAWTVLPHVLSACDVRRMILIGHSDGGTISLMYTARQGRGVLGIVTAAAHVFVDDLTRDGIRRAVAAFHEKDLKDRLARYHGPKIDLLFRRWADTWLSRDFAAWNIESLLKSVTCPVLAIQGDADEYGTTQQMTSITANTGGRSEAFLVPGCRHAPHLQAQDAVADRIIAFLRPLDPRLK